MIEYEYYKVGDTITTTTGKLKIIAFNGCMVYCSDFATNDENKLVKIGECMLTPFELAQLLEQVDGKTHKVAFTEE